VGGGGGGGSVAARVLLVWPQERGHFAADEADEGAREHLVGLPSGVLKVVVWVSQHVKKSLNQFFILRGRTDTVCQCRFSLTLL